MEAGETLRSASRKESLTGSPLAAAGASCLRNWPAHRTRHPVGLVNTGSVDCCMQTAGPGSIADFGCNAQLLRHARNLVFSMAQQDPSADRLVKRRFALRRSQWPSRQLRSRHILKSAAWLLFSVALALPIYQGLKLRFPGQFLDAAGFADLIGYNAPNINLVAHYFYSALAGPIQVLETDPAKICSVLASDPVNLTPSMWPIHPYVVAIPLGIISALGVSAIDVGLAAIAFSVAGGITATLIFLMRRRVPIVWIVPFALLVLLWPVLSEGLLGQPYFDRIFFGPGIVVVLATWMACRGSRIGAIIAPIAVITGALISERSALIAGIVAVLYPIVLIGPRRALSRRTLPIMVIGGASICWFVIWLKFIQAFDSYNHNDPPYLLGQLARFTSDPSLSNLRYFLLINIPLLVLVALAPRGLILAGVVMAPNILLYPTEDTGLVNLVSHYHQLYASILVGLAAVGLANAHRRWGRRASGSGGGFVRPGHLFPTAVVLLGLATWSVAQAPAGGVNYVLDTSAKALGSYSKESRAALEASRASKRQVAEEAASYGEQSAATVSAVESYAVSLYQEGVRSYTYLPAGVWLADVVIADYPSETGSIIAFPFWDGPGLDKYKRAVQPCVQRELDKNYRIARQQATPSGVTRIYVRKTSSNAREG